MQRFDEHFLLKEVYQKMAEAERKAVLDQELRILKYSEPTYRQRLAHTLIKIANWLTPGIYNDTLKDTCVLTRAHVGIVPSEPCG